MDDDYDYRGRVYEILTEAQSAPISKEDAEWIIGVVDVLGHLYDGAMQDCNLALKRLEEALEDGK